MELIAAPGGEPIPGYRFVRKLGQGGFGEVWEAEAPGGVRVALKIIRLDTNQARPELRALEIIRNIRHPHLLDIQFAVEVDDALLIAMPLCDQSLWDRLKEHREAGRAGVPRAELMDHMADLAKAVDFLNEPRHPSCDGHLVGIQHRDIKPHNVFLVGGCVRLADFGLAKVLGEAIGSHTGSMSVNYVPPEALQGRVTPHSDQYSLAVTYCHLRTGRLPIPGKTVAEIIYNHIHHEPDISPLPEAERPIVLRALSKEPDARWPNCQAFVASLRQVILSEADQEVDPLETAFAVPAPSEDNTGLATSVAATRRPPTLPATQLAHLLAEEFDDTGEMAQPLHSPAKTEFATRGLTSAPRTRTEPYREPDPEPIGNAPSPRRSRARMAAFAGLAIASIGAIVFASRQVAPGPPDREDHVRPDAPPTNPGKVGGAGPARGGDEKPELPPPLATGPPTPTPFRRPLRGEGEILRAIRDHQRAVGMRDGKYHRYFTFASLGDRSTVGAKDLQRARSALAELIGRLGQDGPRAALEEVDADGLVVSVDLRRVGWAKDSLWSRVLEPYPYGLTHGSPTDPLHDVAAEVESLTGEEISHVRADWFIATASRPPLGRALLRLADRQPERNLRGEATGPVALVADSYSRDLGPVDVANELGLDDVAAVREKVRGLPPAHSLGLDPFASGFPITRDVMEKAFDLLAIELDLGTPHRSF